MPAMHELTPNLKYLKERAGCLRSLRSFFDSRGFFEVQPPCLARDSVVDAYLEPLQVEPSQFGLGIELPGPFELQTSPESAMKRMLAAGAPSLYSIGPVFRGGERGDFHNTEFTMLEWYEVGADLLAGVRLLGELAEGMVGRVCDVCTYRELFRDRLQLDPIDSTIDTLRPLAEAIDAPLTASIAKDRDSLLDFLMSERLQPAMGIDRPLIVTHYPISQAALAKASADDPDCAARFELFVGGMEIANGYDELRDVDELRRRFERNNDRRVKAGRKPMKVDTTLLQAMRAGLPPCAGVALGVDRLLMAITGAKTIDEVIPLPIDRA